MNLATDPGGVHNIAEQKVYSLPVDLIFANPFQPRRHFDPMALVDLAKSIEQYGMMQPINVRLAENGYELVAGERRLRASKLASLPTIPAIIIDITDAESAVLAMVENLQRQNLSYIEEAEGYSRLISTHNLTQEELAKKMGKNQSTIANKLRLLKLPAQVKKALVENDLSERHARAMLLALKDRTTEQAEQLMLDIIAKIAEEGMTVQKAEEFIEKSLELEAKKPKPKAKVKIFAKDVRIFTNTLKQAVGVMLDSGVDASYNVEEQEDGCVITVRVKY